MMNRREALQTLGLTTVATAGMAAAAKSTAKKTFSPDQSIRVAIIGVKGLGGNAHLPSIVGNSGCQLAAVCDVDKKVCAAAIKKATELYAKKGVTVSIRASHDYRDIMADKSIDAVVIATPDHWHVPLAKAAILAGKDVYVEKPLSFYVTEGRELVDMAKERDVIIQVGSQHRTMARIFLAQAAVEAGLIGEVKEGDVVITTRSGENKPWEPQPVPPELDYDMYVGPAPWTDYHPDRVHYNFRFVPDFSGGEIANWGAHFLDSFVQIMGLDGVGPVSVEGAGKRHPAGSMHYSFYDIDVKYRYANGVKMNFMSKGPGKPGGITLYGSKAKLFVNRSEFKIDNPELMRQVPKEKAEAMRKTKGSHMENWLACVRSRRKQDIHAPVEIGHQSAILCHLANIALEIERPLEWDQERESFRNDAHANALLNRPVRETWRV